MSDYEKIQTKKSLQAATKTVVACRIFIRSENDFFSTSLQIDFSGEFARTPVDCEEHIKCVLCTHAEENRQSVKAFLAILLNLYQTNGFTSFTASPARITESL